VLIYTRNLEDFVDDLISWPKYSLVTSCGVEVRFSSDIGIGFRMCYYIRGDIIVVKSILVTNVP
jgi:hypothetical protein